LGLDRDVVVRLCKEVSAEYGVVEPATFNGPGQTVVAGLNEAVDELLRRAKEAGAKRAVPLAVSGPFHSSLLRQAGEKLKAVLEELPWRTPQVPVVANVTASALQEVASIQR